MRKDNYMRLAAKKLHQSCQIIQDVGSITESDQNRFSICTDHGVFPARRAVSCLIEPVVGDRVLIAGDPADNLFIIAVLERLDAEPLQIVVDRDLSIGIKEGRFSIAAGKGVHLVSSAEISLTSAELTVNAIKGNIFLDRISYLGRQLFAEIDGIKFVGRVFEAVFERIAHKSRWSYCEVEEIDQVRSGQIDYRAEKNMNLRGQNALVTAEDLVKIDGDQIHLG
jgi:hypothetical protein